MRTGYTLPQVGPLAGPEALARVARTAEEIGYDSLWVLDRLLYPVHPRSPYPAAADGVLPEPYQRTLDPLLALSWAASLTKKVALGTSVLCLPFYNPVLLARSLATLDVLSAGRLRLGVGSSWSPDEFEATGVPFAERGGRTEEAITVLEALWKGGTVEHEGTYFSVPQSVLSLRPMQQPRPKIYMAAYAPVTLKRAGERADGWMPAGLPNSEIPALFGAVREAAAAAGRDPSRMELIVRANLFLTDTAIPGPDRYSFTGSLEQIADDVGELRQIGADEVIFETQFSPGISSIDDHLEKLRQLKELAA